MDYMRIIAMLWLKCLSELFEKMKRIVKSKDLTPEKVGRQGILRGAR